MPTAWETTPTTMDQEVAPRMSPFTDYEIAIVEKYDPLSEDNSEKVAGHIVRSAVNIARFRRSVGHDRAHRQRLIESAVTSAVSRFAMAAVTGEVAPASADDIRERIDAIDWDGAKGVPRPIVAEAVQPNGSIAPVLTFEG